MYIIGAHMDGIGWGEAANDDGSGTALVMEMARVFSSPDVTTDVSIRFALWNGEEGGLRGARAYVAQREKLQGIEDPPGSGRYPEPKWLGMIQHDMMMFDHGMPRADGTLSPEQRPEADFNIEWQSNSKMADASMKLALAVKLAADKYTTDYPGTLGPHMTNTDSGPFMDIVRGDQPARKRARHEHRRRLESALAPADGPVRDVLRQGFQARAQRGAGDAVGDCAAHRREDQEIGAPGVKERTGRSEKRSRPRVGTTGTAGPWNLMLAHLRLYGDGSRFLRVPPCLTGTHNLQRSHVRFCEHRSDGLPRGMRTCTCCLHGGSAES